MARSKAKVREQEEVIDKRLKKRVRKAYPKAKRKIKRAIKRHQKNVAKKAGYVAAGNYRGYVKAAMTRYEKRWGVVIPEADKKAILDSMPSNPYKNPYAIKYLKEVKTWKDVQLARFKMMSPISKEEIIGRMQDTVSSIGQGTGLVGGWIKMIDDITARAVAKINKSSNLSKIISYYNSVLPEIDKLVQDLQDLFYEYYHSPLGQRAGLLAQAGDIVKRYADIMKVKYTNFEPDRFMSEEEAADKAWEEYQREMKEQQSDEYMRQKKQYFKK